MVFLLFDIGLHFSLGHIWDARKDILGLGPVHVILCTPAFALIVFAIGLPLDFSIIIGATLALSSTAVVAQILADNQRNNCPVAVSTTAVLIFQDICAIFLLILASSIGDKDVSLGKVIGIAGLKAIASFVTAILVGRYVIGPFFRFVAKSKDDEIFTAMALLIVLSTAAATGLFGLSLTLGAFLAGMIIEVIIVGMGEVGKSVANALNAHDISYQGVDVDHDCFMDACANGYTVGFGDATDLRLMDTIKMSRAKTIVITFANYDIASQLAPIVLERYPDLKLTVSVSNVEEKIKFDALGMQAVIHHSFPRGLGMAAAVSAAHKVDTLKINAWMKRQPDIKLEGFLTPQLAAAENT